MDWLDILTIISFVLMIIFSGFGITIPRLFRFVWGKRGAIFKSIHITVVSVLTVLILYFFVYFPVSMGIFDSKWALLLAVVVYFAIWMWLPLLASLLFSPGRLARAPKVMNLAGPIALLIGYWAVSWPSGWLAPFGLTCAYVVAVVAYYAYSRRKARKER